jgi:hypothetical protein
VIIAINGSINHSSTGIQLNNRPMDFASLRRNWGNGA